MADVENQHDSSFPVKRKPDIHCPELDNVVNKSQKLNPSADSEPRDGEINGSGDIVAESAVSPEKTDGENGGDIGAEEEEEDEEEDESSEDEIEIDRKGKGISREDKGKGKLIEEEEDDESDDSDDDDDGDCGDEDDESDFSDDPLAEVDLGNILPSRTRRRSSHPGLFISNQITNRGGGDSSDDSEA